MAQSKGQAIAVRELEALGVSVGYRYEWDYELDRFSGAPAPGPVFLRKVLGEHFFLTPDTIIVNEYNGSSLSLAPIAALKTVTGLGVTDTPIGDDVLEYFSPLQDLKELSLFGTQITDSGLESLVTLARLRNVTVTKTQVTVDGIARFKEARPQCQVWTEKVEGFDENNVYHLAAVDGAGFVCNECGKYHSGSPAGSEDDSVDVDYYVMGNTVHEEGWFVERIDDNWSVHCPDCQR
jgi:hypothetical protein